VIVERGNDLPELHRILDAVVFRVARVEHRAGHDLCVDMPVHDRAFEDIVLDALPDLLVLVELRMLRRAIGPMTGIGRTLQRHFRVLAILHIFTAGQVTAIECVVGVV